MTADAHASDRRRTTAVVVLLSLVTVAAVVTATLTGGVPALVTLSNDALTAKPRQPAPWAHPVPAAAFPAVARIGVGTTWSDASGPHATQRCTATLVTTTLLLTAAHCLPATASAVWARFTTRNALVWCAAGITRAAVSTRIDVAAVTLTECRVTTRQHREQPATGRGLRPAAATLTTAGIAPLPITSTWGDGIHAQLGYPGHGHDGQFDPGRIPWLLPTTSASLDTPDFPCWAGWLPGGSSGGPVVTVTPNGQWRIAAITTQVWNPAAIPDPTDPTTSPSGGVARWLTAAVAWAAGGPTTCGVAAHHPEVERVLTAVTPTTPTPATSVTTGLAGGASAAAALTATG